MFEFHREKVYFINATCNVINISNWHGNKTLDYNFYRQNKLPSHESKHFKLKMTSLHDTSVQDIKQEFNFNKTIYYKTYKLTFPAQTFTCIFH